MSYYSKACEVIVDAILKYDPDILDIYIKDENNIADRFDGEMSGVEVAYIANGDRHDGWRLNAIVEMTRGLDTDYVHVRNFVSWNDEIQKSFTDHKDRHHYNHILGKLRPVENVDSSP